LNLLASIYSKMQRTKIKEIYLFNGYESDALPDDTERPEPFEQTRVIESQYTRTRCAFFFCGVIAVALIITALLILI
tara:strand:+ start:1493 stop:1723 length:231 start_codon:yes stop_codon:yes gene_type:complete